MTFRPSPGACIICGAAHTACTTDNDRQIDSTIVINRATVQSARPDLKVSDTAPGTPATHAPQLEADRVQATLPPGAFTTGTYRRPTSRPRS